MPEIGIEQYTPLSVRKTLKGHNVTQGSAAHTILRDSPDSLHGGNESVIVKKQESDTPDGFKMVMINYQNMSPSQAKFLYYTHNIFATLFPNNFPHFHAVFATDETNNKFAGSVREGIARSQENSIIKALKTVLRRGKSHKYPILDVRETCAKYQIPLVIDTYENNFIDSENGGQYYVDTIKSMAPDGRYGKPDWNLNNVLKLLHDKPYSDETQRKRDIEDITRKLIRMKELDLITLS